MMNTIEGFRHVQNITMDNSLLSITSNNMSVTATLIVSLNDFSSCHIGASSISCDLLDVL